MRSSSGGVIRASPELDVGRRRLTGKSAWGKFTCGCGLVLVVCLICLLALVGIVLTGALPEFSCSLFEGGCLPL